MEFINYQLIILFVILSEIYMIISKFSRVFLTIITLSPHLILFENIIMYELSHSCMANGAYAYNFSS